MIKDLIKICCIFIPLFLIGCVTAKTITGPDGTENQLISCLAVEQCYEKAREICAGPYKIINTSSETSGSDGSIQTETKLLVKCGN